MASVAAAEQHAEFTSNRVVIIARRRRRKPKQRPHQWLISPLQPPAVDAGTELLLSYHYSLLFYIFVVVVSGGKQQQLSSVAVVLLSLLSQVGKCDGVVVFACWTVCVTCEPGLRDSRADYESGDTRFGGVRRACTVVTVVEHNRSGGGGGGKRATTQVLQQYSSRFFTFSPDFVYRSLVIVSVLLSQPLVSSVLFCVFICNLMSVFCFRILLSVFFRKTIVAARIGRLESKHVDNGETV
ncbi:hypothetical protein AGLY_008893 [Aphis glycines]|uniref:Uncharacterized protein n=1 Tax=Aphis glycines TaxID=307491 RepID=A0A6G0TJ08_APHGL|nr:hypothetical protein AGLY_008893 [Aphis glycines]